MKRLKPYNPVANIYRQGFSKAFFVFPDHVSHYIHLFSTVKSKLVKFQHIFLVSIMLLVCFNQI